MSSTIRGSDNFDSGNVPDRVKAWVNFDGVTAGVPIRAAYNVTSITDLGVGKYQVNFTVPMPDTNYAAAIAAGALDGAATYNSKSIVGMTVSTFSFNVFNSGSTLIDDTVRSVVIFG